MPFEHDFYTVNREYNGLVWLVNKGIPSGKGKRSNDGVWWCRVLYFGSEGFVYENREHPHSSIHKT